MDAELNNTLIVLTLKVQNPEDFSQFRPISLCTIIYKLVMKIIVNWFKLIFPKIILPEQVDFITSKNITDNIVITQEVIHSMKSNRSKSGWLSKLTWRKPMTVLDRISSTHLFKR